MFHTKSTDETLRELECSVDGLSSDEVALRTRHYGKNILPEGEKRTLLNIFTQQFKSPVIYVLLIAAVISIAIKEFSDAGFIMAALLVNAVVGTYQEYNAGERADALKKVIKTYVNVLRDGNKVEILSEDVTLGDIVFFESGVKAPADIRLIETNDLQVNESLLTGESIEVSKNPQYISQDEDEPIGERQNMLYGGSLVTKGRAIGVVTAIAQHTEVGKIASLLAEVKVAKPPLMLRMEKFSLNISKIISGVALLIIMLGVYQDMPLKDIFFLTVALAVSAIPEGLPVAITVALSVASSVMSKRNVIVRKLSAIEGLGSCTFIASDKTGTMTQNSLSVEHFITPKKVFSSSEAVDEPIILSALLCNESTHRKEDGEYLFIGDQVDIALSKYALLLDETLFKKFENKKALAETPYEPLNKYSAASYEIDGKKVDFIKGSPEVILAKCELGSDEKEHALKQVDEWAANGFRNIALAYRTSEGSGIAENGYIYLGFAAITDPLREGVKEALRSAEEAGIEVVMVTGDHPNTAFYIARELGIAISRDEIIDGVAIAHWKERGAQKEEIANKRVFARVSPEQKQLIVKTFQELGHFVAVTGDGVNDAPALKFANIGIAMGKSGTDVARESSDLILTDDHFGSIVNGVEEGRVAYDNIRKVIHLLIATGFAEIVLVLLSIIFFIPIPLLPVQILWLNLVANGIQDVALAVEKAEPGVLKRKPRDPKEPIFNRTMISRVVVGGLHMGISAFALFYTLLEFGYQEEAARNITLLMMVLFENVHAFNSRSENRSIFNIDHAKNMLFWISVISAQGIHMIAMYTPFMQSVLSVAPVSLEMWATLLLIALTLVAVMEAEKFFRRKFY
ncbi:HAD-IC family P-type ATPase [Sulfurimonas sp.]|jgi:calcium-translocating P-type ATPase|uniref:cation-translocating P-type ATPase n=1 Tax=Sulfurimonas sp. TaxID=2022749 RepID=UPI002A35C51B|nr:HAD-IC family P-type ATPase [Sulfurimonas sp.]MDY0122678.1 HAD-IC family P-type ATPase [Sulfurimonas sp.]